MALARLLGRDAELAQLDAAWRATQEGEPQLVLLWGRRRVGKTFLASHFIKGKRSVFFGATQQAERIELGRLAEAVRRELGSDAVDLAGGGFASWEAALRFLAALARDAPLVVVIDEVPYLAESTKGFASVVQAVWDHLRPESRLMLMLTGSAVGMIEDMLGAGGALRGRPTLALRLDPFSAIDGQVFLPDLEPTGYLEAYAACGGYPLHLRRWDARVGTEGNLLRLACTTGATLFEDAFGILREELPDVGGYPRILAAIGRGRTRQSEIADEAAQRVEHPLDVLVRAGFVRRSVPLGATRRTRPLYGIDDAYLAFWFSVLYSDLAQISAGQGHAVLRRRRGQWQKHLGWVFEELARDHAVRMVAKGVLPDDLLVGRWWSTSGPATEIDVLGLRDSQSVLLGEARWQAGPFGSRDAARLMAKWSAVPNPSSEEPMLALWARGGIQPEIMTNRVLGFDLAKMLDRET